ncbi:hypothetical protein ACP70R_045849 [Stipagrostis hirtigluma subsp. patula]
MITHQPRNPLSRPLSSFSQAAAAVDGRRSTWAKRKGAWGTYPAPDVRSFQFRVSNLDTINPPCPANVPVRTLGTDIADGFSCTSLFWPHWDQGRGDEGWVKVAVEIARKDDTEPELHGGPARPPVVIAHVDLPTRDGRPLRTAVREAVAVTGDVVGGASIRARRDDVVANCLVDGNDIVAVCTAGLIKNWPPPTLPPLPDLSRDIVRATASLADVAIKVDGATFKAHSLVLAARSPVFKAELFGEATDASKATSSITIEDMSASTFKSVLDFMYHNTLPTSALGSIEKFKHLLIAAERYGLDTLKQVCEETVSANMTTSTVISSLEAAEELRCPELKSRCLDFLATGDNLKNVATTQEYICLMKRFPYLLHDVQQRF